jgi:hypothetical protein
VPGLRLQAQPLLQPRRILLAVHRSSGEQIVKPYYDCDGIVIVHSDCRDVLPTLDADVMVTDPPYGIQFESNRRGDRWEVTSSLSRTVSIVGDDDTSLRDSVLLGWGNKPALVFGTWKTPRPSNVCHVLTWDKGDHLGMGDLSLPWRPNTEEIYVIGSGFRGHRGTSVLRFPGPVSWASRGRTHPHEKPVALLRALIEKCPQGTILDPFMGSGTTLRAAKDLGRKAIGIEIEERYCEIAARRLSQMTLFTEASA